jgi:hypothetical protein
MRIWSQSKSKHGYEPDSDRRLAPCAEGFFVDIVFALSF